MNSLFDRLDLHAERTPHRVALRDSTRAISYGELRTIVSRREVALSYLRYRRIALLGVNCIEWLLTDLAARKAGITVVPVPPFFTGEQIEHLLDTSQAEAVWSIGSIRSKEFHQFQFAFADGSGYFYTRKAASPTTPPGVAKITYTSGTTGTPKGVLLRQSAMDLVLDSLEQAVRLHAPHVHMVVSPLAVLLENLAGADLTLWIGGEVHVPTAQEAGFSGSSELNIEQLAVTAHRMHAASLILSPQILQSLVEHCERTGLELSSLRYVAVGGATVSASLVERAKQIGIPAYVGYGLSELSSVVALNVPGADRHASVGRLLPHVNARVSNAGELILGGPSLFSGYLGENGRVENSEYQEFASGDLGHVDKDGFVWVDGRIKDQFITSFGRNVSPEWVESELQLEPEIAQAAVFGEARPFNIAILAPADNTGPGDIQSAVLRVNERLPDYARISRWITAPEPFSPVNDQATPGGRLRRDQIERAFRDRVNTLYETGRMAHAD